MTTAGLTALVAGVSAARVLALALAALTVTVRVLAGGSGSLGLVDAVKADLALLVNLENANLDLVTDVEDILNLIDATLSDAGDVQ